MADQVDPNRRPDPATQTKPTSGAGKPDARPSEARTFAESGPPTSTSDLAKGRARGAPEAAGDEPTAPLFSDDEHRGLRGRWAEVQAAFVDEPRTAVEKADELVAQTMQRLAEVFAEERARLEGQWDRGEGVSTEDLRQVLRRYRSFFGRLLAV
jgi:hypothetical protein